MIIMTASKNECRSSKIVQIVQNMLEKKLDFFCAHAQRYALMGVHLMCEVHNKAGCYTSNALLRKKLVGYPAKQKLQKW